MKTKLILILILPIIYVIMTSSSGGSTPSWEGEYVSFPMMNIEINSTMKEHDRQKEMRKNQLANATVETVNRTQWNGFKDKVTKIQDRLRIVSFAIQAIPTGIAVNREITKIIQNQTAIVNEIETTPLSIIAI